MTRDQIIIRLVALALSATLGIVSAQAADQPASGTLVPGVVIPGTPLLPAPPAAPAQGAPSPAAPAAAPQSAPAAETPPPAETPATRKPPPHRPAQHKPAARKEAPAKNEATEKPGAVEEAARTCIHNRLKELVAADERGDIAADAALNTCTTNLKAEFKAQKKSYCEAVAYIGWLVGDENSKLNGVQGQPYQPNKAFLQDCAKTHSWENPK